MAGELSIPYTSGETLYAIRTGIAGTWFDVVDEIFEEAGESAFEDYIIEMTEAGGLGWYVGDDPDPDDAPGGYIVFRQVGMAPAETDPPIGSGSLGPAVSLVTAASDEAMTIFADYIVRRSMVSAEASEFGDELDLLSIYGLIQAAFEASRIGEVLTVRKNDDTVLGTRDLTIDEDALPVTGVS